MSTTKLLFAPISGGGFVSQLAFFRFFCLIGYRPNVMLTASGGGVASFITNCCEWNADKMDEVLAELSSNTFVLRPFSIVSLLAFPFRLALYYKSPYLSRFINKYIPRDPTIPPIEQWALTINTEKGAPQMSCNYPKGSCSFDPSTYSSFVRTYHVTGGIHEMGEVIYASAAIPYAVQPGTIAGDSNVDGGMWMPSSLSLLASGLSYSPSKLQVVYVSSYNVFMGNVSSSIAKGALSVHIHATCLTDVERGIDLLRLKSRGNYIIIDDIPESELSGWFATNDDKEYFLYCYPEFPISVNPVSFTGTDVVTAVKSVTLKFKAWVAM